MYSKSLLFIFFFAILIACDSNTDTGSDTAETNADSTVTDPMDEPSPNRGHYFNKEEQALLGKYIDQTTIDELSDNMFMFADARTDAELEKAFVTAQAMQDKIEKAIGEDVDGYQTMETLGVLDSVMPPFSATCAAECTIFRYTFSIKALANLAQHTTGKSDDNFCELIMMAEGEYGGRVEAWYSFIERTWDYGGGSILGDGKCLDFLKASWEHTQTTPLFRTHIMAVREACLRDMAHPIYMAKKDAVLKELDDILAATILSTEEEAKVQDLKTKVMADKKVQYDCANGNCDFGG